MEGLGSDDLLHPLFPVTSVVDGVRGLLLGVGPVAKPVIQSVIWMAAIVAVFATFAISRYRRRV
jgi:hypothetical protein